MIPTHNAPIAQTSTIPAETSFTTRMVSFCLGSATSDKRSIAVFIISEAKTKAMTTIKKHHSQGEMRKNHPNSSAVMAARVCTLKFCSRRNTSQIPRKAYEKLLKNLENENKTITCFFLEFALTPTARRPYRWGEKEKNMIFSVFRSLVLAFDYLLWEIRKISKN